MEGKVKKLITIMRKGKPIQKIVWVNASKSPQKERVNYLKDTREINQILEAGKEYTSVTYGAVKYIGRSMSDGRLEFRILNPDYRGKKLRLSGEQYKTEIKE